MRYLMRRKFFSLGADLTIQNEAGEDVFLVDQKILVPGVQLSFQDLGGAELAFIRRRLLAWRPTFEIHSQGVLRAVVKRSLFAFLYYRFRVETTAEGVIEATGDFTDHEYLLVRDGCVAATVSKQWFTWTDSYGVDVAEGEDAVLVLAVAVVIHLACHARGG